MSQVIETPATMFVPAVLEELRRIRRLGEQDTSSVEVFAEAFETEVGEDWTPDLGELFEVRTVVLEYKRAAEDLLAAVDQLIAGEIGEGGKVRVGPEFYTFSRPRTFRIRPEKTSEFWKLVYQAASNDSLRELIPALFNPNQVRKSGLKAFDEHGVEIVDEDTGEISSVFSLFEDEIADVPKLQVQPADGKNAPKYARELPEGIVHVGFGKGKPKEDEVFE